MEGPKSQTDDQPINTKKFVAQFPILSPDEQFDLKFFVSIHPQKSTGPKVFGLIPHLEEKIQSRILFEASHNTSCQAVRLKNVALIKSMD